MSSAPAVEAHVEVAAAAPARQRAGASTLARDVMVLGLIWGSSVVFQRTAVAEIEPVPLVGLRIVAALFFFVPFLPRVWRALAGRPRVMLDVGIVGALNPALCGVLSGLALQFASSGLVAVLISLGPLLTALLAKLMLDEPPLRRGQVAGLACAFGGVALLILTRSTGLSDVAAGDLRGHLFALAIALLMAIAGVYNRRRLSGTDALAMAAGQNAGALLVIAPAALLLADPVDLGTISAGTWIAVVISGTIGLGASFVMFQAMIARHGPTAAMLALYTMPVAAAALGALFLGEAITATMVAGAGFVLAGVVLFTWRRTPTPNPPVKGSGLRGRLAGR